MSERQHERVYSVDEASARLAAGIPKWQVTDGMLCRRFDTGGWRASMMIANAVAHLAELAFHHPELRVNYPSVEVRLWTHSAGGITDKDFALAKKIEEVVCWDAATDANGALEGLPDEPRFHYLVER
jgi:4a-hydroxytetrahydrobiopterin dehydratase